MYISKAFAFNYPVSLRITRNYCFIVFSDFSCLFLIKNQGISRVVIFVNVQFSKCLCFICLSETAYLLYHNFLILSSAFSEIFVIFYLIFKSIYCFIQSIPIGFLYSFGRLVYYITYLSFCQVLFRLFSKSFCDYRFRQATCLL